MGSLLCWRNVRIFGIKSLTSSSSMGRSMWIHRDQSIVISILVAPSKRTLVAWYICRHLRAAERDEADGGRRLREGVLSHLRIFSNPANDPTSALFLRARKSRHAREQGAGLFGHLLL